MPDWEQNELDAHAAWLDREIAAERAEAEGFIVPDFEQIDAYGEKVAFG